MDQAWLPTCLLLLTGLCVSIAEEKNHRQPGEGDALFTTLDKDHDGMIKENELEEFIRLDVGGTEYDELEEAQEASLNVWDNLLQNPSLPKEISAKDMAAYWQRLGKILTVEKVGDWVQYGLQLPELADRFRQHRVTGYDLPSFFRDQSLFDALNITSRLQREQVLRGLRIRLLGVSDPPLPPHNLEASVLECSINLMWKIPQAPTDYRLPLHSYRLQRRVLPHRSWRTLWTGMETDYKDECVDSGLAYEYKLESWSAVGESAAVLSTKSELFGSSKHQLVLPLACSAGPPVHCLHDLAGSSSSSVSQLTPFPASTSSDNVEPASPEKVSGPTIHESYAAHSERWAELFFLCLFSAGAAYYLRDRLLPQSVAEEEIYEPLSPHPSNPLVGIPHPNDPHFLSRSLSDHSSTGSSPRSSQLIFAFNKSERHVLSPSIRERGADSRRSCRVCGQGLSGMRRRMPGSWHRCHGCKCIFCANCGQGHRKWFRSCGSNCLCKKCIQDQKDGKVMGSWKIDPQSIFRER
eukprot:gb/GEZN01005672.1/.p1 GENE.gb/GEZN01005672.1/~~gb/GEZN01005672.1/.p1  ORF type:complete len:522 (-),score=41.55 gb/GEZN01005672.1/:184-1749(-)